MTSFMINSANDLALLRRSSERQLYGKVEFSQLILRKFGDDALTVAAVGLTRHLNACGCGLASVFVVLAIAVFAISYGTIWPAIALFSWKSGAMVFAVLCSAALLGKLIGLAYSEWRFRQLLAYADRILKSA
jgi:hypothetical protein